MGGLDTTSLSAWQDIADSVTTHDRSRFLPSHTLYSIELHSQPPDLLIITNDSDPKTRGINEQIVADLSCKRLCLPEGSKWLKSLNHQLPDVAAHHHVHVSVGHLHRVVVGAVSHQRQGDDTAHLSLAS